MLENKYAQYIRKMLDDRTLYEQIAEEGTEVSKASLKLIRALGHSINFTPKTPYEAYNEFVEEVKDVALVLSVLYGKDFLLEVARTVDENPKMERWAKRLGYKED